MELIKLTSSEWNVLNCLWERSPRTVMGCQVPFKMSSTW